MILNPFIEIRTVPDGNVSKYFLVDYLNRKRYVIDLQTFLFICLLSNKKEIIESDIESKDTWIFLIDNKILVDETENTVASFIEMKKQWEKYNWKEAFKYHLSTLDYPFEGDLEVASKIMKNYGKIESDNLRDKKYSHSKYSLMNLDGIIIDNLDVSKYECEGLTKEKLLLLLSFVFGYVKSGIPSWDGEKIYHRTTPSGGSRQPTQGYLYVIDIPGMEQGWYYINGNKFTLESLEVKNEFDLDRLVILNSNYNIDSKCLIVLTSLFEKNMYRYREPRTYRTIHIDVGHIISLIENLSSRMNFLAVTQYGINDEYIENILKINFLEEGYQSIVALGTSE